MAFRSYDSLHVFDVVARRLTFTAAADELNLTKGAISYQIKRLESELGFPLFVRRHRGVALTEKGRVLAQTCQAVFGDLDRTIDRLRDDTGERITIGMSTYFASRWLSPRLMTFMTDHPKVALRLQPLIDLIDLRSHDIDMAIRWGRGDWTDLEIEPLLPCPAFVTAGAAIARQVEDDGLDAVLAHVPLLHDRDGSDAWRDWFDAAGRAYPATPNDLVIPDPNVRVQAVIDGQGLALNDDLVADDLAAGHLARISPVALDDYGYFLAYPKGALVRPGLRALRDWLIAEASGSALQAG